MNLYLFNAPGSAATYGIGNYIKELTYALEGTVINVHVVNLHSSSTEFEIVKEDHHENWYVPEVFNQNTFSGSMQKLEDYCRNVIYLLRLNIKDTKDLVFHINYNHYQFFAKELKTAFDCKTVATVHFMKWTLELNGNVSMLKAINNKPDDQRNEHEKFILRTVQNETCLYKEVDRVIALSSDMRNFLCNEYQLNTDKISIIPNGLADLRLEKVNEKPILRKKWHIHEREILILFAGRLHSAKGLSFLIKAFRKVLDTIPDCRLLIAGSGNYEMYFWEAKEICTKITFTGLLGKNDLHELYQIANMGVIPSLYETFCLVAVEMMMHELPIVATATSGLNEVIDDASGLKIPVLMSPERVEIDTNLLADKIVYLLEHPQEAKILGKKARKRYEECYSREVFRNNMCNFYLSLYE